ncbi:hypothetical protein J7E88_09740 [Streptomyces sp. ISL-10]|uniref:hypothetical protein n=1 Tax=Streptomyces sp. ISL-10 TaxID=2819172 RepID=UPI001BEC8824|nr:hypothetical protein [Streptomyces sp. ISL-10]MBT2365593.1 hypothetical protein [Streptomyces sp. ISL-10]
MIVVRPEVLAPYPVGGKHFTVIAEKPLARSVRIAGRGPGGVEPSLIPAEPSASLAALLATEVPAESDVLVLATRDNLLSAPPEAIGPSRVVVGARLCEGPLAQERLRRLLTAMERTRPDATAHQGRRLLSALRNPGGLTLHEPLTGSVAALDGHGAPQSAPDGAMEAGGVQMAPIGRMPVRSTAGGTPLTGTVTVKGRPVVGGAPRGRQRLYERLTPLVSYPMVLTIEAGKVLGLKSVESGSTGAAAALAELFRENEAYRAVTGVVFGLNTELAPLPYNTEATTASADGSTASFHVELGGDATPYRITLACATTGIYATDGGEWLAGAAPRTSGRPMFRLGRR